MIVLEQNMVLASVTKEWRENYEFNNKTPSFKLFIPVSIAIPRYLMDFAILIVSGKLPSLISVISKSRPNQGNKIK